MNLCTACFFIAAFFNSFANATDMPPTATDEPQPIRGHYQMYGGDFAELLPPAPGDTKLAITVKGSLAKELFAQIGPSVKKIDACSSDADYKERRRGNLSCIYTKKDGHTCYFGLDLNTGKSTNGAIC